MAKKFLILSSALFLSFNMFSCVFGYDDDYERVYEQQAKKYAHYYQNPPKQRLYSNGRYVHMSSGVRYVHSRSPLKNKYHAARIDAYNRQYENYYY